MQVEILVFNAGHGIVYYFNKSFLVFLPIEVSSTMF